MAEFETDIGAIVGARTTPTLRDRMRAKNGRPCSADTDSNNALFDTAVSRKTYYRSIASKKGYNGDDFEDLYQKMLIKVWKSGRKYDSQRGEIGAWLTTIFVNTVIDQQREDGRRYEALGPMSSVEQADEGMYPVSETIADTASGIDPHEVAVRNETIEEVRESLGKLPPEQRQTITLLFLDEKTQEEVQEEMGDPMGTVKTRSRLGLKKLSRLDSIQQLRKE